MIHPALCQKDAEEAARDLGEPNAEDPLERAERVLSKDELANVRQRVLERAIERVKAEREDPDQELTPDCPICAFAAVLASLTPRRHRARRPGHLHHGTVRPPFLQERSRRVARQGVGERLSPRRLGFADRRSPRARPAAPPSPRNAACQSRPSRTRSSTSSASRRHRFTDAYRLGKATGATEEELEEIERESAAKHDVDPESAVGLKLSTPLTLPSRKVRLRRLDRLTRQMLATWDLLEEWSQGEENEHDKCLIIRCVAVELRQRVGAGGNF